jgi:hypothetical protein
VYVCIANPSNSLGKGLHSQEHGPFLNSIRWSIDIRVMADDPSSNLETPSINKLSKSWKRRLDPRNLAKPPPSLLGMGRLKTLKFGKRGHGAVVKKKDGLGHRAPREVSITNAKRFQVLFTGSPEPTPERQASTLQLLSRFTRKGSSLPMDKDGNPITFGPKIRYQTPVFFPLPEPEPVTKPVLFHHDKRFEDPRAKLKDPGMENLSCSLEMDDRHWREKSAYVCSTKKTFRRGNAPRKDDPPHCYITMKHKTIPFEDTKIQSYSCAFRSGQERLGKTFEGGDGPGPGSYRYAQDSCHIKNPERQSSSFKSTAAKQRESKISKPPLTKYRGEAEKKTEYQEHMKKVIAKRRHMELPFPKRRHKPVPKVLNKVLGPGQYKGSLAGWDYARSNKSRAVQFSKSGLNKLGSSKTEMENFIATIDPSEPRKHKWPRDEFALDTAIVKSSEDFWKQERIQNTGPGDDSDDSDDE